MVKNPESRTSRRVFLRATARVTFLASLCATVGATIVAACGGKGSTPPDAPPTPDACVGSGYGYSGCGYGY